MILFFSAILLLTGLSLSYVIYSSSENLIIKSMGEQARTVAASAVKLIDPAKYKGITPENGENDYYNELRGKMNELRETNGLKYLYTMAVRGQDDAAEYYYVVDGAPANVSEDDFSPLGEVETEHYDSMIKAFETKQDQVGELSADSYGATITAYVPILGPDGGLLGVMGADFDATNIYAQLDENRTRLLWTTIAIIAVALLFVAGFTRYIVKPLRRIAGEMQRVQNGDLTAQIPVGGRDEIGRLATGFSRMTADLNAMIAGIKKSADVVRQSAQTMSASMELSDRLGGQVKLHLEQAAAGADAQRSAAADTSRAMEEVGTGVMRIAEASSVVADASRSATDLARGGGESIDRIARQMKSIHHSAGLVADDIGRLSARSNEIGQIVDTIGGIAGQTNLLALNAAIEAAHAGEQGRGFAVVADQIRKLAAQSETSAGQIAELLEAMILYTGKAEQASREESREVEQGLNIVREAGEAFAHIGREVQLVADQVQELSAISEQIAAAAQEVTASVDEIARMSDRASERTTGIVSASLEQAASANEARLSLGNLNVKAAELEDLVKRFKV